MENRWGFYDENSGSDWFTKRKLNINSGGRSYRKRNKKSDLEAEVVIKPLADGGEGTVDALVDGMGGKLVLGFSGAVTKEATACNEEEKCTGESDRYGRTGISFDKSFGQMMYKSIRK